MMHRHDAALARLSGEIRKLGESRALILQADEAKADMPLCLVQGICGWATDGHTETLTYILVLRMMIVCGALTGGKALIF